MAWYNRERDFWNSSNGGFHVTIRNWIKFSLIAILIGGSITGVLGLFIRWDDVFSQAFASGEWGEIIAGFVWMVIIGVTMSLISQMGFFAYLTVHQFGMNMFRSLTLWNWVQLLIIAIVIFDLIAFRFAPNADTTGQAVLYGVLLAILIGVAVVTAYFKAKWTKKSAFISALFFMIAITTLEWLPALMVQAGNADSWVTLLLFPLMAVNAFQLLMLPKYNEKSLEVRQQRRELRTQQKKQSKATAAKS